MCAPIDICKAAGIPCLLRAHVPKVLPYANVNFIATKAQVSLFEPCVIPFYQLLFNILFHPIKYYKLMALRSL